MDGKSGPDFFYFFFFSLGVLQDSSAVMMEHWK